MNSPTRQRQTRAVALVAFVLAMTSFLWAAQTQASTYLTHLAIAQQSVDSNGHTVVVMQAAGDLPGVLTLVLSTSANGTITGGEWAMNVSYTAPLHPGAAPDPTSADPDSAVGEQLIQKGVLSGKISSGSATMANGQVQELSSLQLVVTGGSMQFAKVSAGSGSVSGVHIDDRDNSSGNVSLTF
jgi:hypothetical protein